MRRPPVETPAPGGNYIITFKDLPVARYAGGIAGLAATRPAAGRKLNIKHRAVVAYTKYILDKKVR